MAEEATQKEMPKDLNSTSPKITSGQDLFLSGTAEESEDKRSKEELKQDTSLERTIQSPELLTITKSSYAKSTDEVNILGLSDEGDCSNVETIISETDFPSKYSETTEKCEEEELGDCDIEPSHKVFEQSIDTVIETSEPCESNVGSKSDKELSSDIVQRGIYMPTFEIDSHQVAEQCVEELVGRITCVPDHEPQYSAPTATSQRLGGAVQLIQQNQLLRNLLKIVPQEAITIQSNCDKTYFPKRDVQKLELQDESTSDEYKIAKLKETLKYIDVLSSCIVEIGRMNEIFKNVVIKMLSDIMILRRSTKYVQEYLTVLESLPACTILFHETDRLPQSRVNVYDFGVDLLHDLSQLFLSFKELLMELNEYRLKFVELSEHFSAIPFEFHVGELGSNVLDLTFEAAIKIYEDFFENDGYEILHQQYVLEHEDLQKVGIEFDIYLRRLGLS